MARGIVIGEIFDHCEEFVTTDSGQMIARTNGDAQSLADRAQRLIATLLAQRVINVLEIIDVDVIELAGVHWLEHVQWRWADNR